MCTAGEAHVVMCNVIADPPGGPQRRARPARDRPREPRRAGDRAFLAKRGELSLRDSCGVARARSVMDKGGSRANWSDPVLGSIEANVSQLNNILWEAL